MMATLFSSSLLTAIALILVVAPVQAGVTGLGGELSVAQLHLAFVDGATIGVTGSPLNGPVSFTEPNYGSATCSKFGDGAFQLTVTSLPAANRQSYRVLQGFTLTEPASLMCSGWFPNRPWENGHVSVTLRDAGGSTLQTFFRVDGFGGFGGPVVFMPATAQGQHYRIEYSSEFIAESIGGGPLFRFEFGPPMIPGPAGASLLALAGLLRRRRVL